ncbi:T9SS type A sorting domain-containing protein [Dyadobacter sp. CY312]|uniref:T9SS type A sorting domain-containing protein n=1 Tax=Dyadobacter sp. CY312 TaxID=2907303 RepID=UPI001F480D9D|nr:T9SS type A sorting domain-containing protein [Dyadobacter sp. CY312]MCE7043331.1 T9SS type A sorting domain-containing protein [Dyadobacter sp. CY312]
MKKILLNYCFAIVALVVTTSISWAQGELAGIQYRNIKVADNGQSFSMEIWGYSVEPGYTTAAAPWSNFTIRMDLNLVGGATAIGTLGPQNITFGLATAGSLTSNPPGAGDITKPRLGINLDRGTGANLTAAPQRLATVTIPVTGGQVTSASVAFTRPNAEVTGSYWKSSKAGEENVLRAIQVSPETSLPVTLTSFKVSKEGTSLAQLNWTTTQEANSSHFEIERSGNASDWQVLGRKESSKNSSQLVNYNFTDVTPISGMNYYRLKMVDLDGTFAHSRVESINFGEYADRAITVFPNPVSDVLYLNDLDVASMKEVALISADGIVAYQSNNITTEGISVKNLIDGLYIVKVTRADGSLSNHRVLITR